MVLALSGTMTMGNQLEQLERNVRDLATSNQNRIVLDMSRITYLDSSAIGVLVSCHGTVRNFGGQLRLAGVTARVGTIFKMTGVGELFSLDLCVVEKPSLSEINSLRLHLSKQARSLAPVVKGVVRVRFNPCPGRSAPSLSA
jgi:anti-anti-sigma factor